MNANKTMPPMAIDMMIHFYTTCGPYHNTNNNAYREFVEMLEKADMIRRAPVEGRDRMTGWDWQATPRGAYYVQALTMIPFPVMTAQWEIPFIEGIEPQVIKQPEAAHTSYSINKTRMPDLNYALHAQAYDLETRLINVLNTSVPHTDPMLLAEIVRFLEAIRHKRVEDAAPTGVDAPILENKWHSEAHSLETRIWHAFKNAKDLTGNQSTLLRHMREFLRDIRLMQRQS